MGSVKIPYYAVIKGRGYWQPTRRMRALGFQLVRCGPDGPGAWAIAREWSERWERVRTGRDQSPAATTVDRATPETADAAIVYPSGSLGHAFRRYRQTTIWSADKAARTREDWWRGWALIRPVFGDIDPSDVTLEMIDAWRSRLLADRGIRETHRAVKIWRALWKVAAAMRYCERDADPSLGLRNRMAESRSALWSEGEAVRLVKAAWRSGFHGLAAIMAVAWDTQMSPVDVRSLTRGQLRTDGSIFIARAKTEESAGGVLSRRTLRLVNAWLAMRGVDLLPAAPLFLAREVLPGPKGGKPYPARPYTKDSLGREFREIRELVFSAHEKRQLADFRRSGAVEAITGGAEAEQLSHAMGNTLSASNVLYKTYVPSNLSTIRQVAEKRRTGRRKIRDEA